MFLFRLNKDVLVKQFCAPLCLKGDGSKEELVGRIMEFLLCPTDSGEVSITTVITLLIIRVLSNY